MMQQHHKRYVYTFLGLKKFDKRSFVTVRNFEKWLNN